MPARDGRSLLRRCSSLTTPYVRFHAKPGPQPMPTSTCGTILGLHFEGLAPARRAAATNTSAPNGYCSYSADVV
eukprot:1216551-Pyramimonas_sp.AAC.1